MKALLKICLTSLASALLISSAAAQPGAPAPTAGPPAAAPAAAAPAAAAATTAAPAATEVAPTAAPAGAVAAPAASEMPVAGNPPGTPATLKDTYMAAINNDQQWTDELAAVIEKSVRFKVHNEEAELIAMNKRHVVMAYAVLWLFSIAFLFAQWRRQQALKQQIESLKSELAAAVKGTAA